MHLPSLFVLIVYVSGYLFLLFSAICLACGLYYLVELAEEYTMLTKKVIRYSIFAHFIIYFLLVVYERFPFWPCFVGFIAHLFYFQLLKSFPFLQPTSFPFLASIIAFILDNIVWFQYFRNDVELFYRYRVAPVPSIAAFFLLIIWLVPCAFFCSITINDSVLPGATIGAPNRFPAQQQQHQHQHVMKKRRKNIVMAALDSVAGTVRNILGSNSRPNDIFS